MKRSTWLTLGLKVLGVVGSATLLLSVAQYFTGWLFTDPYVVPVRSVRVAPDGAKTGYRLGAGDGLLYVVSGNETKVIADPGESFKYTALWIVEKPRSGGESGLLEMSYQLPKSADQAHINPPGVEVPPRIQKATGTWH